jgi:hypothetical protein
VYRLSPFGGQEILPGKVQKQVWERCIRNDSTIFTWDPKSPSSSAIRGPRFCEPKWSKVCSITVRGSYLSECQAVNWKKVWLDPAKGIRKNRDPSSGECLRIQRCWPLAVTWERSRRLMAEPGQACWWRSDGFEHRGNVERWKNT